MIYNIALLFDKEINKEIHSFYEAIKESLDLEFGLTKDSIPHCTIIKFESSTELNQKELKDILNNINLNLKVEFSGITFLPSHNSGCWIEIPILKSSGLIEIQNEIIKKLECFKIKSGVESRFRPHITLAKTKNNKIKITNLDNTLLRKKEVNSNVIIGLADSSFEFYKLNQ